MTKTIIIGIMIAIVATGFATAYALTTVTGDLNIENGELGIGINDAGNDDVIKFDDGSETISWEEANTLFRISERTLVDGDFQANGAIFAQNSDLIAGDDIFVGILTDGEDDSIFFDLAAAESLKWKDPLGRFELSDDLRLDGDLRVNTIFNDANTAQSLRPTSAGWTANPGFKVEGTLTMEDIALLVPRSSAPSCMAGTIYYDSDDNTFCFCENGTFEPRDGVGACT